VATGRIPRESGVQLALIDLLIDEGAKPGSAHGAIAHGNLEAARRLIERGGQPTLSTTICLGTNEEIRRSMQQGTSEERQVALVVASFYGKPDIIKLLIENGVDVNMYPDHSSGFHSHATALHQAVFSGSLESVKILVKAGADLNALDRVYQGTPLGWAKHMQTEAEDVEAKKNFKLIEDYLKQL
jgi:peptide-methionine (S)-S-oxide reductase